ncbi:MAG: hypothetical protein Q9M28_02490 [Mariprofundaceae bacterium]|nr:hypothetical protein [Mariprofundaceae bacterium]
MRLWLGLLCLLLSVEASASDMVTLRLGASSLSPSGNISVTSGAVAGTTLNLKNDMNLKKENFLDAEASVFFGQHSFHLAYLNMKYNGVVSTPSVLFNFNGSAFANPPYYHELKAKLIEGSFAYYPLFLEKETWRARLGAELGVKSFKTTQSVRETAFAQAVSASALLPSLGIRGHVAYKEWVALNLRYGVYSSSGNQFSDFQASLDLNPLAYWNQKYVSMYVGYRQIKLKLSGQNNNQILVDTTFKGPVFGLLFRY